MILSRRALVGLAVGATAGLSLVAFILYRECSRRSRRHRSTRAAKLSGWGGRNTSAWDKTQAHEADLQQQQQQVLSSVEAVVQGLSPEQQLELRNQLDQVRNFVSTLRLEVTELSRGLQNIAAQIIQDVKKGVEENQRGRRWPHLVHGEQDDSAGSSSSNFTATQTVDKGYSTGYTESEYTDKETDREEGETDTDVQMEQRQVKAARETKPADRKWGLERELKMIPEEIGMQSSASLQQLQQSQKNKASPARELKMLVEDPSTDLGLLLAHSRAARLWDKNST
ncbi:uncharacterized protein LOC128771769 [Synchiropus splendidus]|uniref:uncharacterized protein LOC128771769 n=1 Tax=Synchiropus splendidus TaxID=270530 RepID=UPI00237E2FE9|nr:uncharacterized protein LOC128771769 [Synchiropus splendidus]